MTEPQEVEEMKNTIERLFLENQQLKRITEQQQEQQQQILQALSTENNQLKRTIEQPQQQEILERENKQLKEQLRVVRFGSNPHSLCTVCFHQLKRRHREKLESYLKSLSKFYTEAQTVEENYALDGDDEVTPGAGIEFHPGFCCDVRGGALSSAALSTCNAPHCVESYKTSLFTRCCDTPLEPKENIEEKEGPESDKNTCFNCGEYSHTVANCPHPRDVERIRNARQEWARSTDRTDRPVGGRYYLSLPVKKYDPGFLSPKLREALGMPLALSDSTNTHDSSLYYQLGCGSTSTFVYLDTHPPYYPRMHQAGYPPGYWGNSLAYAQEEEEEGEVIKDQAEIACSRPLVVYPGLDFCRPYQTQVQEQAYARACNAREKLLYPTRTPILERPQSEILDGGTVQSVNVNNSQEMDICSEEEQPHLWNSIKAVLESRNDRGKRAS